MINATPDLDFCEGRKCKNLRIKIRDHPSENIYEHFEPVTKFIGESRRPDEADDDDQSSPSLIALDFP